MTHSGALSDLTVRELQAQLPGLLTFQCVAAHLNFARAAADLKITPTAVSKSIKSLEEQLGVRLFNRNTRSTALTEAGAKLLADLKPALEQIRAAVEAAISGSEKPAGLLRLNCPYVAYATLIEPHLQGFLDAYPGIVLEVWVDNHFADIVNSGFDAGVRLGQAVQRDMIAVRLGRAQSQVAVASPDYLDRHGVPESPEALLAHKCIRQRLASKARFFEWTFKVDGKPTIVDVEGQLVVDEMRLAATAARNGVGIAYVFRQFVEAELAAGSLMVLLDKFSVEPDVFHIYYPSNRQMPGKLRAFIDHIRTANAASLT